MRLTESDAASESKYQENNTSFANDSETLTYTSARVLLYFWNKYKRDPKFLVYGYYTNWSQYDGRLDAPIGCANHDCGRGQDIQNFYNCGAYDKLVLGFFGIMGDDGEKGQQVTAQGNNLGVFEDQITSVDTWGDVKAWRNCGKTVSPQKEDRFLWMEGGSDVAGALGAMRLWKANNKNSTLAISIGGWTLSKPFHVIGAKQERIRTFVDSVVKFFQTFREFQDVDVDWEYPNAEGNTGHVYSPEDVDYFVSILKALRANFNANNLPYVKITIATSASVAKIESGQIYAYAPYVDAINLMSYDFFGGTYSTQLSHHTNLKKPGDNYNSGLSISQAVECLVDTHDVDPRKIFIGYAAYSRNAYDAKIESYSPLRGTCSPHPTIVGTFESGVTEWYDLLANYLEYDGAELKGKNGYTLYHDAEADADYLYSEQTRVFMSLDTPRSVRAKAQYARERNLGGLFTWLVDYDNGLLSNAAHEGLGEEAIAKVIDMSPFYKTPPTKPVDPVPPPPSPPPEDPPPDPLPPPPLPPDKPQLSIFVLFIAFTLILFFGIIILSVISMKNDNDSDKLLAATAAATAANVLGAAPTTIPTTIATKRMQIER